MSSSVGMMKFPTEWKVIEFHGSSHHQPDHLIPWKPSPIFHLVGGAITILKNMKVNGKDDIPYMKWKIKAMFETTNQD